jgi:hypothetical protein
MLSQPTTSQILTGVANELRDVVAAEVHSEPVKVLVAQLEQVVRNCAERAAHEIAWIHEEAAVVAAATGVDVGTPASLHLADVAAWYSQVSGVLGAAVEAAFADRDSARQAQLKEILDARSATEMGILGTFEFVGRG